MFLASALAGTWVSCSEGEINEQLYIGISSPHYVDVYLNQEPVIIDGTGQFFEDVTLFVSEGKNSIDAAFRVRDTNIDYPTELVIVRGKDIHDSKIVFEKRDIFLNDNDLIKVSDSFIATNLDFRVCFLADADLVSGLNGSGLEADVIPLVQKVFDAYRDLDFSALDKLMYSTEDCYWELGEEIRALEKYFSEEDVEMEFANLEDIELRFGRKTVLIRHKEGGLMVRSHRLIERSTTLPTIELEKLWLIRVGPEWHVLP